MSKTKTKPIKAMLGFAKTAAADILARANAVYSGMNGDTDYSTPPVDMATFKGAIDIFSSKITAALDGGKKAIAERNRLGQVLIKTLRHLGKYVEMTSKDDMTMFLSSGFRAKSTGRGTSQALSQFIRSINPGPLSGQVALTIAAVPGAHAYETRWGVAGAGGTSPAVWTSQATGKTRPPVLITGLTPGTNYVFQVRSLTGTIYSEWSDSVVRICT